MSSHFWHNINESNYPWERDALEFIRQRFPDREPYRAWQVFDFIAGDGGVNEVDLLLLTPVGFFLVEIKSRPGIIRGDAGTWTWEHEGKLYTDDNPVIAANRKAKKLKELLEKQKAIKNFKRRLPFLDVLVFCSAPGQQLNLEGTGRSKVCLRDRDAAEGKPARPGIIAAVERRDCPGLDPQQRTHIDRPLAKAIAGDRANAAIAAALGEQVGRHADHDSSSITIDRKMAIEELTAVIERIRGRDADQLAVPVSDEALEELKFSSCLPPDTARRVVEARLADLPAVRNALAETVRYVG